MKKFKLGKNALILSITTLVTVLAWISFSVYRATTKVTITKTTQQQMSPLEPEINRKVFEETKNSLSFEPEELDAIPLPSIQEVALPEATEGGQTTTESASLE